MCDQQQALQEPVSTAVSALVSIQIKDQQTCDDDLALDGCSPMDVAQISQTYDCLEKVDPSSDLILIGADIAACMVDAGSLCNYWK